MIASVKYTPTPGDYYYQTAELMYVTPLVVCRSGVQYDVVSTTPSGRQVQYTAYNGRLTFDSALTFGGSLITDTDREDLFIKYKI